mmetsp:Transcript_2427/g.6259  ORF Transcript_2427/g.6259 Transcript_2427/m.6259 type:complete len:249 (+) Transcript_2427:673-1419(+)
MLMRPNTAPRSSGVMSGTSTPERTRSCLAVPSAKVVARGRLAGAAAPAPHFSADRGSARVPASRRSRMMATSLAWISSRCTVRSDSSRPISGASSALRCSAMPPAKASRSTGCNWIRKPRHWQDSARCLAVMDLRPETCIAPAPSTSWHDRLLNTLTSSTTRCATSLENMGMMAANLRYSSTMASSSSTVRTTWKARPRSTSVSAGGCSTPSSTGCWGRCSGSRSALPSGGGGSAAAASLASTSTRRW